MSCSQKNKQIASTAAPASGVSSQTSMRAALAVAADYESPPRLKRPAQKVPTTVAATPLPAVAGERVVTKTEGQPRQQRLNSSEALLVALAETGKIDWARIAAMSGQPPERCQQALTEAGLLFSNPAGGWELRREYLSGNVRRKLEVARQAAQFEPRYQPNVRELEAVQPKLLTPSQIYAPLGAGWIPERDVKDFAASLGIKVNVAYIPKLARWNVRPTTAWKSARWSSSANIRRWGTPRIDAVKLLEQALNGREPTVNTKGKTHLGETYLARDQQRKLKTEFQRWLWSNPTRSKRLAALYNRKFNNTVKPSFDGSYLTLPGYNRAAGELRPHQKNTVLRIVRSAARLDGENVGIAHATGTGKTRIMWAATRELRRLGIRSGPIVHIVPRKRVLQHRDDGLEIYPAAKILTVSSNDIKLTNQVATLEKMQSQNWDAIVISQPAFERIKLGRNTQLDFIKREVENFNAVIDQLPARATRKRKMLLKQRDSLQAKLDKGLATAKPDPPLTWEKLNVDHLFGDEWHRYKNWQFATRKQNMRGVAPKGSTRASDAAAKLLYLQQRCQNCGRFGGPDSGHSCSNCGQQIQATGGRIALASATFIDNSIGELYTWQRVLQPRKLREMGLEHFDAWAAQFAQPVTEFELGPTGGFRETTRLASFANVPELSTVFSEVADVQLEPKSLGITGIPEVKRRIISSPMPAELQAYMQDLNRRAEKVRARGVDPREDNFLKISTDARKASLDIRLVNRNAPDYPDSKVNRLVSLVGQEYRDTTGVMLPGVDKAANLTQLIFLDSSTPKAGFNLYDDIKRKLVQQHNIPAEQIAFSHDAKSDEDRLQLFQSVNRGDIRILIASTEMAGEGVNLQKLASSLYHVDMPWTPKSMIQRIGRMVRQGNQVPSTKEFVFVTEGSFDGYSLQTLERKAKSTNQLLTGKLPSRSLEDVDQAHLSYAEIKAVAAGDPIIRQKVQLQKGLQGYYAMRDLHEQQQQQASERANQARADLAAATLQEARAEFDLAALRAEIEEQEALASAPYEYASKVAQLEAELLQLQQEMEQRSRPPAKKVSGLLRLLRGRRQR